MEVGIAWISILYSGFYGRILKDHFEQADFKRFQERLEQETKMVRSLFAKREFDNSSRNLGYELELCLADAEGHPSKNNIEIIEATGNPLFTSELAKFNMEINGNPFPYKTNVFNRVEADLNALFQQAEACAHKLDTQIGMFGVFPSVTPEHLNPEGYMTELHRYDQLNQQLLNMRGQSIRLHLEGDDILKVEKDDVMLEALATSLQIHLQVPFDEIVPTPCRVMVKHAGTGCYREFTAGARQVLLAGIAHRHLQTGGRHAQSRGDRGSHHSTSPFRQALHRLAARPVRRQFLLQPNARSTGTTR